MAQEKFTCPACGNVNLATIQNKVKTACVKCEKELAIVYVAGRREFRELFYGKNEDHRNDTAVSTGTMNSTSTGK